LLVLWFAEVNECATNPCSVTGTCVNTPGGFVCSCPDKTRGNAYSGTCEAQSSQLGVHLTVGTLPSTPTMLVHFLNELFTVLEKLTNNYNVRGLKVDTLGTEFYSLQSEFDLQLVAPYCLKCQLQNELYVTRGSNNLVYQIQAII
jgi:hypothetical protein